jgi:hypothetical protein
MPKNKTKSNEWNRDRRQSECLFFPRGRMSAHCVMYSREANLYIDGRYERHHLVPYTWRVKSAYSSATMSPLLPLSS